MDSNLLARYLSDECSAEEREQVEDALAADPALQRRIGQLRTVWHTSPMREQATDLDGLWHQIAQRTGIGTGPADQGTLDRRIVPLFSAIRRYAAVAVFLIACFAAYYGLSSTHTTSEWVALQTQYGEHAQYTLSEAQQFGWMPAAPCAIQPSSQAIRVAFYSAARPILTWPLTRLSLFWSKQNTDRSP